MKTCLNNFARQVAKSVVVRRPGEGHNAAVIGRNRRLVEADIAEVMTQLAVAVERFIPAAGSTRRSGRQKCRPDSGNAYSLHKRRR